jgi:hypothetical protein
MRSDKKASIFSRSIVLWSESESEFASLLEQINQEIQPESVIERMFVRQAAELIWEIMRISRARTGTLMNVWQPALADVLQQIMFPPGRRSGDSEIVLAPRQLAYSWFVDKESKTSVEKLLKEAGIGWSAIEARAYCLAASDLERMDRSLALLKARLEKDLRFIGELRKKLGARLSQISDRVLEKAEEPLILAVNGLN